MKEGKEMKKLRILLMFFALAMVVTFIPVKASAKEDPKLNVKKLTIPKYTQTNAGNWFWLEVTGTKKKVKWTTSNEKVVEISVVHDSLKDSIRGLKPGKATITAKVGTKTLKCTVTVTKTKGKKSLMKLVTYDASTVKQQYITYTNNSDYYLGVSGDAYLYNANSSNYSDQEQQSLYLKPGETVKVWCQNLYDRPTAKFKAESAWIWYEYHPLNITAKALPVKDGKLPIKLTNNSTKEEGHIVVTVFFKKGKKIVWTLETDTMSEPPYTNIKPGKSRTVYLSLFNVPDYDTIAIQTGKSSGHP
jgi:hypothetical protein